MEFSLKNEWVKWICNLFTSYCEGSKTYWPNSRCIICWIYNRQTTHLIFQLMLLELLQNKTDLIVYEQRGYIPPQVFAVVLCIIIALPAGVDPQTDLPDMVPAVPTKLPCTQEQKPPYCFCS